MSIKCRRGSVLWRDICDFFFVFSAENCFFSAVWCARFHAREREECLFSRGADSFLKKFLLLFFLVVVAKYFFFAERKQAEQLFKFCFFVCLLLFFFRSFHTRETCVLRRKVISHIVIIQSTIRSTPRADAERKSARHQKRGELFFKLRFFVFFVLKVPSFFTESERKVIAHPVKFESQRRTSS